MTTQCRRTADRSRGLGVSALQRFAARIAADFESRVALADLLPVTVRRASAIRSRRGGLILFL